MAGVRQFDEEELLGKVLDTFWTKGFSATSMLDLAQATGVLRGSLYNAYGTKEELFQLAFDRYAARFLEAARNAVENPDPEHALMRFFDVAIANMTGGSPPRGCLTTKTAAESDHVGADIQAKLRHLVDDLEVIIFATLSSPTAQQRLRLEPRAAAELVVTFTRGLAVMERVYQCDERLRRSAATLVQLLFGEAARRKAAS